MWCQVHSHTHSLTSLTRSLTHSLTHFTHSLTHTLTHSLTKWTYHKVHTHTHTHLHTIHKQLQYFFASTLTKRQSFADWDVHTRTHALHFTPPVVLQRPCVVFVVWKQVRKPMPKVVLATKGLPPPPPPLPPPHARGSVSMCMSETDWMGVSMGQSRLGVRRKEGKDGRWKRGQLVLV